MFSRLFSALFFSSASRRSLRLGTATKLVASKHLWLQLSAAGHQVIFSRLYPIRIFVPYMANIQMNRKETLALYWDEDLQGFQLFKRKRTDSVSLRDQVAKCKGCRCNAKPSTGPADTVDNTTSVVQEVNDIATCELPVFELYTSGHNFQHSI